ELLPGEIVLPDSAVKYLSLSFMPKLSTELAPDFIKTFEITEDEKQKLQQAIDECVEEIKALELAGAQWVSEPGEEDYILVKANPDEGARVRRALLSTLTDILGPKRGSIIDPLLKEGRVFSHFLSEDH